MHYALRSLAPRVPDLYLLDAQTGVLTALTRDVYADHAPAWRPDGRALVFHSDRGGAVALGTATARAAANMPKLVDAATVVLSAYLTKAMRLSEPIEPERPVAAYGIDSLAAVEFRNWLRMQLGAALSVIDITTASSLNALSERVIAKVEVA